MQKKKNVVGNIFIPCVFYDYNNKTHDLFRSLEAFPYELVQLLGDEDKSNLKIENHLGIDTGKMIKALDEQAIRAIKILIIAEYARCTGVPGEVLIKSFNGINAKNSTNVDTNDLRAKIALQNIKEQQTNDK